MASASDKPEHEATEGELRRLQAQNRRLCRDRQALLAVQQASAAIASHLDPEQALQEIVTRGLEVVGGSSAAIYLINAEDGSLESRAAAGDLYQGGVASMPHFSKRSDYWTRVCEQGGLIVPDVERNPRVPRERGIKSLLLVPLVARGETTGVLIVAHKRRKRAFRRRDLEVLRLFADQAAAALDNSHLYAQAMDSSVRLRERLELDENVLDGIRDSIALLDRNYRVVFGNQALFAALKREPGEVVGRTWFEFLDPADADAMRAHCEVAGGGVFSCEVKLARPDGSRIPVLLRSDHSHDLAGRMAGAAVMMLDLGDRKRAEQTLRAPAKMLDAIARLTRALGKKPDVPRLGALALDTALNLLGLRTGVLYLIEGGDFVLTAARGMGDEYLTTGKRVRIEGSVSGRAVRIRKPILYADLLRHPRLDPKLRRLLDPHARSAIIVPIPGREASLGVLAVGSSDRSPFTHETMGTLHILAAQFGAAVENVRLIGAARRRAERLAGLNEAAEKLISCTSVAELVEVVCRGLARLLDARRVLYLDYYKPKQSFRPMGGHNIAMSRLRRLRRPQMREAPLLALSLKERQPVLCEDAAKQQALPAGYCRTLGLHGVVAVPVVSRTRLRGALLADNRGRPISLSEDDSDMAMALANQAAMTLDNLSLLRKERRRSEQLSLAMKEAHHRIKNNLQAVCDVLELELMDHGGAASAESIQHIIERVHAIAMVHEFLGSYRDMATVDVAQVLERLVPLAVESSQRRDQRVRVTVNACPLIESSKRTTALALIVNELVCNAVRHGLSRSTSGAIKVDLSERDGKVLLRVTDDGAGLPPGFEPGADGHVGLDIARVLAERDLGGTMTLASRRGRVGGTVARVRFNK